MRAIVPSGLAVVRERGTQNRGYSKNGVVVLLGLRDGAGLERGAGYSHHQSLGPPYMWTAWFGAACGGAADATVAPTDAPRPRTRAVMAIRRRSTEGIM